ncbi:MAG: HD domain-containing protein [Candidatus Krumholzibacteriia bacterium]|nr:HD domain-containing protein [bacterium]MCB9515153.1 HD domain-containing protein [Candidatus Latescibacterota bacterium]
MTGRDPWTDDLLQLKGTPRSGWLRIGIEHPESVASHSFAVGLLAWREARARGLDADKALLMGLLHDFHEARLGDIPSPVKRLLPADALAQAEAELRAAQWAGWAPELLGLLEEFEAGESAEARLVRAMDREELRLQAQRYLAQGHARAAEFLEGDAVGD